MKAISSGLYVHIPYCQGKCIYCDFYSAGSIIADWDGIASALQRELKLRLAGIKPESRGSAGTTIYIGGGTPSLMPADVFRRLSGGIVKLWGQPEEYTIEVNPDDVTEEKVAVWKEAGINRVSIGVQSFDDELLRRIGRRHNSGQAREALEILTAHFDNVSADLIFGLPGQTRDGWREDVATAIENGVRHLSAYSLMYEERTAITQMLKNGMVREMSEADTVGMFEDLCRITERAGMIRYEISNYAFAGYESRHNNIYWKGIPYIGIGPSAHSYDGERCRRFNPADVRGYLRHYANDRPTGSFYEEERLTEEELREEMLLTRMRLADGLDMNEYEKRWGHELYGRLIGNAEKYIKSGKLRLCDGFLSLTRDGVMTADDIIVDLAM